MSNPVESANLILKLYELRREEVMRKARDFFFTFEPKTVEDVMATMMSGQGGYVRMVLSYWDMAASLVNSGAIDAKMFNEANGEQIGVFATMEPLLPKMRETFKNPAFLKNLEQVVLGAPDGRQKVDQAREFQRNIRAQLRSQSATS
jgi:hypothetical protein